jgi:hypothetical protein
LHTAPLCKCGAPGTVHPSPLHFPLHFITTTEGFSRAAATMQRTTGTKQEWRRAPLGSQSLLLWLVLVVVAEFSSCVGGTVTTFTKDVVEPGWLSCPSNPFSNGMDAV